MVGRPPKRRRKARLDGANLNMTAPDLGNEWVGRWINDQKNRPYKLNTLDDWEFVDGREITDSETGKVLVGEQTKTNADGGSRVRMRVGVDKDGPIYAYLMKKRRELCEADEKEKFAELDKIDRQIVEGISPIEKQHGSVKVSRG